MSPAEITRWLARAVHTESPEWPATWDPTAADAVAAAARWHGLEALLAARARASWPEALRQVLHARRQTRAAVELAQRAELVRVLDAFADAGIAVLLLKGAAFAYALYRSPIERPRSDQDLWVAPAAEDEAARLLQRLGYRWQAAMRGRWVSHQQTYVRQEGGGLRQAVDLHRCWNNAQRFARLGDFAAQFERSQALPTLHPWARTLAWPDALVHAVIHRTAHLHAPYDDGAVRRRGDRLIWLADLDRLIRRLSAQDWPALCARLERDGLGRLAHAAFAASASYFDTPIPSTVRARLAAARHAPADRHLSGRRWAIAWDDWLALPHWRARFEWLAESVFADGDYLRWRYAAPATPLWRLQVRRWRDGLTRAIGRSGSAAGAPAAGPSEGG